MNSLGAMVKNVVASLLVLLGLGAVARAADLAGGSPAPAFSLPGSDGKTYTLSQFAGKEGVVLAWFPQAFTPG